MNDIVRREEHITGQEAQMALLKRKAIALDAQHHYEQGKVELEIAKLEKVIAANKEMLAFAKGNKHE